MAFVLLVKHMVDVWVKIMARPRGIEPRSQAPEAYVISIGPRAHNVTSIESVSVIHATTRPIQQKLLYDIWLKIARDLLMNRDKYVLFAALQAYCLYTRIRGKKNVKDRRWTTCNWPEN